MVGIAYTISNLAKKDELPIGDAILKHREMHNSADYADVFPDQRNPVIGKLLVQVSDIDTPYENDLTNGAIYLIDVSEPLTESEKELLNDSENHPLVAHIGSCKFFK